MTGSQTAGSSDDGAEPDPRFTFANERTFLAWSRTALALVVAGLGVIQLLPPFPGVPWGRHVLGLPLIVFGAIVALAAYREWVTNQRAMRAGQPMVSQTRSVLVGYAAAGGQFREVVIEDAGHGPHLDQPAKFLAGLRDHLAAADPA